MKEVWKDVNNKASKLNDEKVREIRKLLADGNLSQKEIGKMFKIDRAVIGRINKGTTWKHVV